MNNTVISLNLAKHVIQAAKFTQDAVMQFNIPMSPDAVIQLLANTKPCIVAMEGGGSFHYWGKVAERFGHAVRAMPPIRVTSCWTSLVYVLSFDTKIMAHCDADPT